MAAREVPSLGLPDPFSSTFRLQPGANYTDPSLAPTHPSKTLPRSERYYIKDATYIESGERWLFDLWFKPHSPGLRRTQSQPALARPAHQRAAAPSAKLVNEERERATAVGPQGPNLAWKTPMAPLVGKWNHLQIDVLFVSRAARSP